MASGASRVNMEDDRRFERHLPPPSCPQAALHFHGRPHPTQPFPGMRATAGHKGLVKHDQGGLF